MLTLKVGSEQYQLMTTMHAESIQQVQQLMKEMANYSLTPETKQLMEQFWQVFPQWMAVTQRIEQERSSNTRVGRSTAMGLSFKESFELFGQTQKYLKLITDLVIYNADERGKALEDMHVNYQTEQLSLLGVSLVICLCIIWFFPVMITGDLSHITQQIQVLAKGGGDLTQRLALIDEMNWAH
ncbi:hypothetical protein P4S72_17115 [Vibrio sp. PP-XX7]